MGRASPLPLSEKQFAELESPKDVTFSNGTGEIQFALPRQGVSLPVFARE